VTDVKKIEGSCSTGQDPQWAVVPVEEEEEEEEEEGVVVVVVLVTPFVNHLVCSYSLISTCFPFRVVTVCTLLCLTVRMGVVLALIEIIIIVMLIINLFSPRNAALLI
jgi:hypothetical protein